jgi:hypothetical protein
MRIPYYVNKKNAVNFIKIVIKSHCHDNFWQMSFYQETLPKFFYYEEIIGFAGGC